MLRIAPFIMLALVMLFAAPEAHGARIGVASVVKNEVSGTTGGRTVVINVGTGVFQNEVIVTGANSSTQLLFRDESTLTMGANSRLTLDRFVYDPRSKTGDVVVSVLQGTFRFVSGSAKPGGYTIKTPVATLGLRGTIIEGYIGTDGSLVLVVVEGSVVVTTADGTTFTVNAGQFIAISGSGVVSGPAGWTGPTLDLQGGLLFILDTSEPLPGQLDRLNEALDSRNLDINFPPEPPPAGGGGQVLLEQSLIIIPQQRYLLKSVAPPLERLP